MYFRRFEEEQGSAFPEKWQNKINSSFEDYFKGKLKRSNFSFQSHGFLHADEVITVITYQKHQSASSPISLIISQDLKQKDLEAKKLDKIKDTLLDISGIIFQDIFRSLESDEDVYLNHWASYEYKKQDYFYKITRENPDLTIEANKLLEV